MIRTELKDDTIKQLIAWELFCAAGMENHDINPWKIATKRTIVFSGMLARVIADDLWEEMQKMGGSVSGKPADSKPATGGSNPSPPA